jgi:hypothetical protein
VAIADFSGGLRQTPNPLLLPAGVASELSHVDCRRAPLLTTRRGRTAFSADPADAATFLGQFRRSDGYYVLLRGLGSTGMVQRWDGASWVDVGAMTPYLPVYAVAFPSKDWIILMDGQLMKKWDGTTFSDLGGAPPALTCPEVHLGKLWGVKERVEVRYSATGNPEDWTTSGDAGYMMFDNAAGSAVTALRLYRSKLYVWTQAAMYAVLGAGPWEFTVEDVPGGAGCWSHFTVAEVAGALYWYGPDGIWEYYEGTAPRLISRGWIDGLLSEADPNRTESMAAGTDGVRYYLSLPGMSVPCGREVVFDTRYRSWWVRNTETYSRYLWWRRP